jgi:hypothetical protein
MHPSITICHRRSTTRRHHRHLITQPAPLPRSATPTACGLGEKRWTKYALSMFGSRQSNGIHDHYRSMLHVQHHATVEGTCSNSSRVSRSRTRSAHTTRTGHILREIYAPSRMSYVRTRLTWVQMTRDSLPVVASCSFLLGCRYLTNELYARLGLTSTYMHTHT